ncbi:hypothetical protein PINS_up006310 [Pythium insidiosum]|nr:hypothetical protein PINS_up006310 [Pythium insidiosum]
MTRASDRVGQRIHVYWADECAWFSGVVSAVDDAQGFYVVYDDGDERWEGPDEIYRFDGDTGDDDDDDNDNADDRSSEGDNDGDVREVQRDDALGIDTAVASLEARAERLGLVNDSDAEQRETESTDEEEHVAVEQDPDRGASQRAQVVVGRAAYPKPVELSPPGIDDRLPEEGDSATSDDEREDDRQSMASSTAPSMHEPRRVQAPRVMGAPRVLPVRGVLRGLVLHASALPPIDGNDLPSAFVRVAFVESSSSDELLHREAKSHLMLRCKQALAATRAVIKTSDPVWNASYVDVDADVAVAPHDGLFQLVVAPPLVGPTREPAWQQLRGELLFSVYHHSADDASPTEPARGPNAFVAQASVSLCRVMRDLFASDITVGRDGELSVLRELPLETRQGKRLPSSAALAVSFRFQPEYAVERREPMAVAGSMARGESMRSIKTSASASVRPTAKADVRSARVGSARPSRRTHQSSSEINRRRFEKQVEEENRAMAKRVAEQRSRGRVAREVKGGSCAGAAAVAAAGAKAAGAAPGKRSHKATSEINRHRFLQQVDADNKAMGKRLAAITRGRPNAKQQQESEWKDDTWSRADLAAQDKAYVQDKRRVLQQEKDYLLEKAQAKYHHHSALAEEVATLQDDVAQCKRELFSTQATLTRLDVTYKNDVHVRDCLRSAAGKAQAVKTPLSARAVSPSAAASSTPTPYTTALQLQALLEQAASNGERSNADDRPVARYRQELRELVDEALDLENQRDAVDAEINALERQEDGVERDIVELHRQLQFVQAKRAFAQQMATTKGAFTIKVSSSSSAEHEEQLAIYRAERELEQLQIAVAVLKDRLHTKERPVAQPAPASTAVNDFLRTKIAKREAKLKRLEKERDTWQRKCEGLVTAGSYERLRANVHELQQLVFLCQSESRHVTAAERAAKHKQELLSRSLEQELRAEQTETELLLKRR